MNCNHTNPRRSLSRLVLIRVLAVCLFAAGTQLVSQVPDVAKLRKEAKEGVAEAQYLLANTLLSGDGVPIDSKQGVEWLRKAADQDHPAAQLSLARMYLDGRERNIPKDPKQGLELMRKSADHGWAPAEYSLGLLYQNGNGEAGISRNPHQAATWFRKAARQPGTGKSAAALEEMLQEKLISKQEANWRAPEPTIEAGKGKAAPFTLAEVETGLKGSITNKRMGTLVQKFGVDFKVNATIQKRLADDGADADLLQTISSSKRS